MTDFDDSWTPKPPSSLFDTDWLSASALLAPKVITTAIGRLGSAARVASKGADFDGHNEVLAIGYFAEHSVWMRRESGF